MQERLKHVASLGYCNDAGCAGVVDAIVEIIDPAGIHNLFSGYILADQLANACAEFCHRPVVLCATKEPHVCIGQTLKDWQRFAIWAHKGTCR